MKETNPESVVPEIEWTKKKAMEFKKVAQKAIVAHVLGGGPDQFEWNNHKWLVSFASYLITHLNEKFGLK